MVSLCLPHPWAPPTSLCMSWPQSFPWYLLKCARLWLLEVTVEGTGRRPERQVCEKNCFCFPPLTAHGCGGGEVARRQVRSTVTRQGPGYHLLVSKTCPGPTVSSLPSSSQVPMGIHSPAAHPLGSAPAGTLTRSSAHGWPRLWTSVPSPQSHGIARSPDNPSTWCHCVPENAHP